MGVSLHAGREESDRGCLFPGSEPRGLSSPYVCFIQVYSFYDTRCCPPLSLWMSASAALTHKHFSREASTGGNIPPRGTGISALKQPILPHHRLDYTSRHAPPHNRRRGPEILPANSFESGDLWLVCCTAAVVNGNRGFQGSMSWTAGRGSLSPLPGVT